MNLEQLMKIMPFARGRAPIYIDHLNAAMQEFGVDTPARQASFLAQIAHESGQLRLTREIWGPTAAQIRYEGRRDLGNTEPGDGFRYRGRGLIQITGRANYAACGAALGLNLIGQPELLEQPANACRSAAWFWKAHGLNELADTGDQLRVTKRINGGTNGLAERLAVFEVAQGVMS